MGWEERSGHHYYYRKRREGDRVVSEYVGKGALAEAISQLDESLRQEAHRERQRARKQRDIAEQQDRIVRDVIEQIRMLTHAVLIAEGYHTHKGQWRKRREPRKKSTDSR